MTRLRFRPGLWPTLAMVLLGALFVHLGQWQAGKAAAKTRQQTLMESRLQAAPQDMNDLVRRGLVSGPDLHLRRVIVRGQYEPSKGFLLDNEVHQGRAGFHVLTPLVIEGSETRVLVDRGWVPFSGDRRKLPEIATPSGRVEVVGHAFVPPARFYRMPLSGKVSGDGGASVPPPLGVQQIWPHPDLALYRSAVTFPVVPVLVRMDADSTAGGFVREWPRPDDRIGMHRGYAIQWFALTAALIGVWLWAGFRKS